MKVYKVDSIVCGHHVFKEICMDTIYWGRFRVQDVNLSSPSVSNETFVGRGND